MRRLILVALAILTLGAGPPLTRYRVTQWYFPHHRGIDFAARYGTAVHPATEGTVVFTGWRRNCGGWQVYIRGDDGYYTSYNHLSRITTAKGRAVTRETTIGRVGTSPRACVTGPHLHFELWKGYPWRAGSYRINPRHYLW